MIALVTSASARDLDADLPLLCAHLADADVVDWHDPDVDWARYDRVLLRSTWDYHERLDEFLDWVGRVDRVTQLWNPGSVVRWNTDKRYLRDLAAAGVPVVPTRFVGRSDRSRLDLAGLEALGSDLVVKPAVGAGSAGAARFRADASGALAHVEALLADGRIAMIQPYVAAIDEKGETGAVVVGGALSHAFSKGAILSEEIEWEGGLYAKERIGVAHLDDAQHALVARVLAVLEERPEPDPLYVRVDMVPGDQCPLVLELELVEPSLHLHVDPGAPERVAAALRGLVA